MLDWFVLASEPRFRYVVEIGAQYYPFYAGAAFSNDTRESSARLSVYPALVWPKAGLHASRQQALAQDRLTFVASPVNIAWHPVYPNPVRAVRLRPSIEFVQPLRVNLPAAPTQWAPEYPDLLNRPVWRRPVQLTPELFPTTVVTFGWKGWYPDRIDRLALPPSSMQATAIGWQTINSVRLEWLPTYPNQHWTAGLKAPWHQVFDINQEPIPNPPSPDLAWGPRYDDWIARAPRAPWFAPVTGDSRIMPPSPDLAWRVTAPDLIAGLPRPVSLMPSLAFQFRIIAPDIRMDWQGSQEVPMRRGWRPEGLSVRPPEVPISPVIWMSEGQDSPLRLSRRVMPVDPPPLGALAVTGSNMGWQAYQPTPTRRHVLVFPSGAGLTEPVLPSADPWCVRFDDDAIVSPSLLPESLRLPLLADQTVRTPQLLSEEVC